MAATPKKELADWEHCTGLKFNPSTLLFERRLRPFVLPSSHTVCDPMHVLFSNGLMNQGIMLFLQGMRSDGVGCMSDVRTYSHGWNVTKHDLHHDPRSAINEVREKNSDDTLKAGASEVMGVYPVVRAFAIEAHLLQCMRATCFQDRGNNRYHNYISKRFLSCSLSSYKYTYICGYTCNNSRTHCNRNMAVTTAVTPRTTMHTFVLAPCRRTALTLLSHTLQYFYFFA